MALFEIVNGSMIYPQYAFHESYVANPQIVIFKYYCIEIRQCNYFLLDFVLSC